MPPTILPYCLNLRTKSAIFRRFSSDKSRHDWVAPFRTKAAVSDGSSSKVKSGCTRRLPFERIFKSSLYFLWSMYFIARGLSSVPGFARRAKQTTNTGACPYYRAYACSCGRRQMLCCGYTPSVWLGVRQAAGFSIRALSVRERFASGIRPCCGTPASTTRYRLDSLSSPIACRVGNSVVPLLRGVGLCPTAHSRRHQMRPSLPRMRCRPKPATKP